VSDSTRLIPDPEIRRRRAGLVYAFFGVKSITVASTVSSMELGGEKEKGWQKG
jgi:hypothetical protein